MCNNKGNQMPICIDYRVTYVAHVTEEVEVGYTK